MENIKMLLNKIKHPEINNTLIELGMLGNIEKKGKKIIVELKIPMLEIPIRELLTNLIKDSLKDFEVDTEFSVMDDEERTNFFRLANQNWAL
jgi:ATP-binding protein involved in chromosome partitioning